MKRFWANARVMNKEFRCGTVLHNSGSTLTLKVLWDGDVNPEFADERDLSTETRLKVGDTVKFKCVDGFGKVTRVHQHD